MKMLVQTILIRIQIPCQLCIGTQVICSSKFDSIELLRFQKVVITDVNLLGLKKRVWVLYKLACSLKTAVLHMTDFKIKSRTFVIYKDENCKYLPKQINFEGPTTMCVSHKK